MDAFYDTETARRRLNNTVCFYDGEPYYVQHYDGAQVDLYPLEKVGRARISDTPPKRVRYTEDNFTDHVPTLGYVNAAGKAWYVTRDIIRDQRAGLPTEAISISNRGSTQEVVFSKGMKEMLLNEYPTLKEAHSRVAKNAESCAFSKNYAIDWELNILHRNRVIGKLENGVITYSPYLTKISFFMRNFGEVYGEQVRAL